jgi:ABC-type multidrug transport system ATPase subunit
MTDAVIQMQHVTKRFGRKTVLDDLNYSLRRGTVTGLLGKNGSGKTTMLKCALGLQTPQEGTITVFDEPAFKLSGEAKARLAYVPQEISLYP